MLTITVPGEEAFDETTEQFITVGDIVLELEHSLVALSKWESEFEKPFLEGKDRSGEELIGYIKAMCMTPGVPEEVFLKLSTEHFEQINTYINAKMTATTFPQQQSTPPAREIVTSELIYYWLTAFKIPFDPVQHWHLNRLFTLIRVANVKESKPKKTSPGEAARQRRELNAKRRAEHNTTG